MKNNRIKLLDNITYTVIILGVIAIVWSLVEGYATLMSVIYTSVGVLVFAGLLLGISEIIRVLENISYKVYKLENKD